MRGMKLYDQKLVLFLKKGPTAHHVEVEMISDSLKRESVLIRVIKKALLKFV